MNQKDNTKDRIVDFIEDEAFYTFRKSKSETEKGTLSIYIFATLSLLSYVLTLTIYNDSIDWFNAGIYFLILIIYYCLGVYSSHEPYTAFISTICAVGLMAIIEVLLTSQLTMRSLILKTILMVFLFLKLEAAKYVQSYNKNKLNK